jgi:hypothetical protein
MVPNDITIHRNNSIRSNKTTAPCSRTASHYITTTAQSMETPSPSNKMTSIYIETTSPSIIKAAAPSIK